MPQQQLWQPSHVPPGGLEWLEHPKTQRRAAGSNQSLPPTPRAKNQRQHQPPGNIGLGWAGDNSTQKKKEKKNDSSDDHPTNKPFLPGSSVGRPCARRSGPAARRRGCRSCRGGRGRGPRRGRTAAPEAPVGGVGGGAGEKKINENVKKKKSKRGRGTSKDQKN